MEHRIATGQTAPLPSNPPSRAPWAGATARRGTTLPELLIAMAIMLLIAGVVSAVYFASLRTWRRCSSQSQADPPAHMTISRLTRELKNAYQVTSMGASSITFLLPQVDGNGVNIVPLTPAREVSYYLSDATGQPGQPGTDLWRRDVSLTSGTVKRQRIAQNVERLAFDYEATSGNRVLAIYALSITVVGTEGHQSYTSRFDTHIAFRNGGA